MVLDKTQADKLIYQLDCSKFFNEVIKNKKEFYKWCKNDPKWLQEMVEHWFVRISNPQIRMHLDLKFMGSK